MMKYEVTVVDIGELAKKFFNEGTVVLFSKKEMPLEMKEISVMHNGGKLYEDIKAGDKIYIGEKVYTVTAVGEKANSNLRLMGHVCLKFDNEKSAKMPGYIHLERDSEPFCIEIGQKIRVES